jgi:osmotically-inducible protein OsmY
MKLKLKQYFLPEYSQRIKGSLSFILLYLGIFFGNGGFMKKKTSAYNRFIHQPENSEQYSLTGESEYSREHSSSQEMMDFLIDRGVIQKPVKDQRRLSPDERIEREVIELLTKIPELDMTEILVKVSSGVVVLEGPVENRKLKRLAELTIDNVQGVEDIMNRLRPMV